MHDISGAAGLAALAICESLLLSLVDNDIITPAEGQALLQDAAAAHRQAALQARNAQRHEDAALLIEHLLDGRNAVRRS
jgi:hypothetical protein